MKCIFVAKMRLTFLQGHLRIQNISRMLPTNFPHQHFQIIVINDSSYLK